MSSVEGERKLVELLSDDTELELLMVVPSGGFEVSLPQPKIIAATATVSTAFSVLFMSRLLIEIQMMCPDLADLSSESRGSRVCSSSVTTTATDESWT
jgi:hypothetical protein